MDRKPIIGIPSVRHELGFILPVYTTTGHYIAAVQAAGGVPVQLPLTAGMGGGRDQRPARHLRRRAAARRRRFFAHALQADAAARPGSRPAGCGCRP